jgi:hypothetical protein
METLNTTSVAQADRVAVTPVAAPRPQAAASSAPVQNAKPAQSDFVDISAQARMAADTRSNTQAAQPVKSADKGSAVKAESKTSAAESNSAEFAVEKNNRVVMRVLKQPGDSVVKEVPSSDDRHVRDTVARLLDNGGNLLAPESRARK